MLDSPNSDNRLDQRRTTLKGGRIVFNAGRSTIDCKVRNLSSKGASSRSLRWSGSPTPSTCCSRAPRASPAAWSGAPSRNWASNSGSNTRLTRPAHGGGAARRLEEALFPPGEDDIAQGCAVIVAIKRQARLLE